MKQVPNPHSFPSRKLAGLSDFKNPFLLLSGLLAAIFLLAPRAEAQSTWANNTVTTGTLVGTGTSGYYYEAGTNTGVLSVGDAVYVSTTGDGMNANSAYYVVAISGSAYGFATIPGGAVASLANTAGTANTTLKGVYTWDASGETDTQSGVSWTGTNTPNGVGAVANIASNNNGYTLVAIQNPETVGTINFSAGSNELDLISSNNGGTTTLSALTFATSTGTPTINDTTAKIIRLGLSDASYSQGKLKISGTQGLILAPNAGTSIRIENVDWSGFTNGSGGMGTLILQSGTTQTDAVNVLGSGAGAINLTVGNASTTGSAGAVLDIAYSSGAQSVNVLSGATNGYIYSAVASAVLTMGAGNGTGEAISPVLSA